jgi:hypothetical protein
LLLLLLQFAWVSLVQHKQNTLCVEHYFGLGSSWVNREAEYVWGLLQDLSEGFGASKVLQAAVEGPLHIRS